MYCNIIRWQRMFQAQQNASLECFVFKCQWHEVQCGIGMLIGEQHFVRTRDAAAAQIVIFATSATKAARDGRGFCISPIPMNTYDIFKASYVKGVKGTVWLNFGVESCWYFCSWKCQVRKRGDRKRSERREPQDLTRGSVAGDSWGTLAFPIICSIT